MLDPDSIIDALTGEMTGHQLAERLGEPSRDVVPVLNRMCRDGILSRTVSEQSVVSFAPAVA